MGPAGTGDYGGISVPVRQIRPAASVWGRGSAVGAVCPLYGHRGPVFRTGGLLCRPEYRYGVAVSSVPVPGADHGPGFSGAKHERIKNIADSGGVRKTVKQERRDRESHAFSLWVHLLSRRKGNAVPCSEHSDAKRPGHSGVRGVPSHRAYIRGLHV